MRIVLLALPALALTGCLARTAVDVVTLPVRAGSYAIDKATTSQSEADRNRGRAERKQEEREVKEQRKRQREEARRQREGS